MKEHLAFNPVDHNDLCVEFLGILVEHVSHLRSLLLAHLFQPDVVGLSQISIMLPLRVIWL